MRLLLAIGASGHTLTLPPGVEVIVPRPVEETHAPEEDSVALVRQALAASEAGPSLVELAAGKRRAAIIVGDLSLPAPYETPIVELARVLEAAGIRPSRITFLCRPGAGGPPLGRGAIRRYGEAAVAEHLLRNWGEEPGTDEDSDAGWDAADLRCAVLPALPGARAALPEKAAPAYALALALGRGSTPTLRGVRAGPPERVFAAAAHEGSAPAAAVCLTTGGGAPADLTLEEALLGLRVLDAPAARRAGTAVLAFSGAEGLGSARFTLDLWGLCAQAEEVLSSGETLPETPPPEPWEPAGALAAALCAWPRLILYAPGLAENPEGAEFLERLSECAALSKRLALVEYEADLWVRLTAAHGARFTLLAEPLGWRAWSR